MRHFLILLVSLLMGVGSYAQNCSKTKTRQYQKSSSQQVKKSSCSPKSVSCTPQKQTSCTKSKPKVVQYIPVQKPVEKEKIKRFAFLFGPGVNFSSESSIASSTGRIAGSGESSGRFSRKNLAGQVDAFAGIRIRKKQKKGFHLVGIWGNTGLIGNESASRLLYRQEGIENMNKSPNLFGNIEAGILLNERIRLSAGLGNQQYHDLDGNAQSSRFLSSSAGFLLPLSKKIYWHSAATIMYGRDFSKVSIRPVTGLMMNLTVDEK